MKVLSVRLDDDLEKKLEFLINNKKISDKSTYLRQLLDKTLLEEIIDFLCSKVGEKQISAWKASEIANISLRKMLEELKKRDIKGYDEESLNEDLMFAFK